MLSRLPVPAPSATLHGAAYPLHPLPSHSVLPALLSCPQQMPRLTRPGKDFWGASTAQHSQRSTAQHSTAQHLLHFPGPLGRCLPVGAAAVKAAVEAVVARCAVLLLRACMPRSPCCCQVLLPLPAARAAAKGPLHAECCCHSNPSLLRGVPWNEFFTGLKRAVVEAPARHGVHAALILCFVRDQGPEAAAEALAQASRPKAANRSSSCREQPAAAAAAAAAAARVLWCQVGWCWSRTCSALHLLAEPPAPCHPIPQTITFAVGIVRMHACRLSPTWTLSWAWAWTRRSWAGRRCCSRVSTSTPAPWGYTAWRTQVRGCGALTGCYNVPSAAAPAPPSST